MLFVFYKIVYVFCKLLKFLCPLCNVENWLNVSRKYLRLWKQQVDVQTSAILYHFGSEYNRIQLQIDFSRNWKKKLSRDFLGAIKMDYIMVN